jgi:hypothetical protein
VLLIDGDAKKDLHFECPRKWSITVHSADEILSTKDLLPKDQIKLSVELTREEVTGWAAIKQTCLQNCKKLELEIYGIDLKVVARKRERARLEEADTQTDKDVLTAYCKAENLGSATKAAGMALLDV